MLLSCWEMGRHPNSGSSQTVDKLADALPRWKRTSQWSCYPVFKQSNNKRNYAIFSNQLIRIVFTQSPKTVTKAFSALGETFLFLSRSIQECIYIHFPVQCNKVARFFLGSLNVASDDRQISYSSQDLYFYIFLFNLVG